MLGQMLFGVVQRDVCREWGCQFVTVDPLTVPVNVDVKPLLSNVVCCFVTPFAIVVVPNDGRPLVSPWNNEIFQLYDKPFYPPTNDVDPESPPGATMDSGGKFLVVIPRIAGHVSSVSIHTSDGPTFLFTTLPPSLSCRSR